MCSSSYQALNSSSIAGGGSVIVSRSPLLAMGDPSSFKSIGTIGQAPRELRTLLGEQHGNAGLFELADRARDLRYHQRRQALGGLVEQNGAWISRQRAGDAEHLLLAARHQSGTASKQAGGGRKQPRQAPLRPSRHTGSWRAAPDLKV